MRDHMIYLDCDQVLTDFIAGICTEIGYDYPGTRNWPEGWPYDMFESAGSSREEADTFCDIDFWANLAWMEDGREILKLIMDKFYPHEITVLTTPMKNNGSYTGKMIWFEKNIPDLYKRVLVTPMSKKEFAVNFHTLLIDDHQSNVEEFIKEGGSAILLPRPYNYNSDIFYQGNTIDYLNKMLIRWMDIVEHPARNRKGSHA